jgi:hypothetical protein
VDGADRDSTTDVERLVSGTGGDCLEAPVDYERWSSRHY